MISVARRCPATLGLIGLWMGLQIVLLLPSARSAESSRSIELKPPQAGKTGFTLLSPAATGLTFTNLLDAEAGADNRVLNNGSGVAAGDFDNDGLVDLFFCSLDRRNRLFKNLGDWTFTDVTAQAGLRFKPLHYRSAVFADLNGDGWLDLLVGGMAQGVLCFLNDGKGHFTETTPAAGTATPYANQTIALADIDGNGTLDLYACNNRNDDIRDWPRIPVMFVNKKPTVPADLRHRITLEAGSLQEFGEPDVLYLNDGRARFTRVAWTNGTFLDERGQPLAAAPLDWGLTAAFRDLNGDGAPDLYVCNDYWTPDRLWFNDGQGRFRAVDSLAVRRISASSMGVDFADLNRDGHPDIFAVDMLSRSAELRKRQMVAKRLTPPRLGDLETRVQTPQNTLLLTRGDGTFAEIACLAGLEASDWSWSPLFLDADLDGHDDLLVTAGHVRDIQDLDANDKIRALQESWRRSPVAATNLQRAFLEAKLEHRKLYPPLNMPVVAFRNLGNLRFEEVTEAWGLGEPGVNHGAALADLDNDGDLDVVVNRLGLPAALFRNNAAAPRLAVRLRGKAPNTQAIGSRIELLGAAVSNQRHEVTCGGSYMSGHDTLRVFAPGSTTNELRLRVTWRDGTVTELGGVKPNHRYEIDESASTRLPPPASRLTNSPPLFTDVSSLLSHTHHENAFDDFARQPLLPRKLSQSGPGVTWFDLNEDGWDDLVIPSGQGDALAVFFNRGGTNFSRSNGAPFDRPVTRDQTTVLGWRRGPGQSTLLAGSASYEDGDDAASGVLLYDVRGGKIDAAFPGHAASVGALALSDVDGDGDLDLFVGGQMVPGRYPLSAGSRLFRQASGQWSLDAENTARLKDAGLVNGAVWSDLDGDGFAELILACEWGPLRVFQNRGGQLREATREWGLDGLTGLWTGVTAGDLDGDGRLDLVAGNWGLNSVWRASPSQPLTVFYGSIAGADRIDLIEAEFDPARRTTVPRHLRDTLTVALPFLAERFPAHGAWSRATIDDVLRDRPGPVRQAAAVTLATTRFLNRQGRFEAKPLPAEAQFAPAFGVCVADLDGDGREDVFLSQNFFAFRGEESRLDAGRGLLLRGDGRGNLEAVPGPAAGVTVYGEQRGAALADFDRDGRLDLVVAQNAATTKLYRNTGARPGLRVRLLGPSGNRDGIGAMVRLKFEDGFGPAREVRAGSGYWSQDSPVVVLTASRPVAAVRVRWPGGATTEQRVIPNAAEIIVAAQAEP